MHLFPSLLLVCIAPMPDTMWNLTTSWIDDAMDLNLYTLVLLKIMSYGEDEFMMTKHTNLVLFISLL